MHIYAEQLQRAAFEGRNLTPQDQEILRRAFEQALAEFKGSKEEYAQRLLRYGEAALLVASALLLTAASAGALTPAARIAVLKFVEGKDFNNDPILMLKELGLGLLEGALVFGPFAAEAAIAMAARSAARAAESVRATFGLDQAARTQIDNALRKPMEEAFKAGRKLTHEETVAALRAAGIPEERIQTIAQVVRRDANAALDDVAFSQRLAEHARTRVADTPARTTEETLRNLLRNGVDDLRAQVGDKLPEMRRHLNAAREAFESGDINKAKQLIDEYLKASGRAPKNWNSIQSDEARLKFIESTLRNDAKRLENIDALINGGRPTAGGGREALSQEEIAKIISDDVAKLFKDSSTVDQALLTRLRGILEAKAAEPRVINSAFNTLADRSLSDEERVRKLLNEFTESSKADDLGVLEKSLPALERELTQAGLNSAEARRLVDLVKKELEILKRGRGVLDMPGSGTELHAFRGRPDPKAIEDFAKTMRFPSEEARQNFINSAKEFFARGTRDTEHGFQILKGPDGNYMLARMAAGNTERDSLKVFLQPLKPDGKIASNPALKPGDDQSLHLLFRRSQGDDGVERFTIVEIKQGTTKRDLGTEGNQIFYQRIPAAKEDPQVNPAALEQYLRNGNWSSVDEMIAYFNRLVRGVDYPR